MAEKEDGVTLKLYEITEQRRAILDEIADAEGEVTPELEVRLDACDGSYTEKVDSVAAFATELAREVEAIGAEIDRLERRRRSRKSKVDWLRGYLLRCLQSAGFRKVESDRFSVSLRKSSHVVVEDEAALPSMFIREKLTRTVDKTAIRNALKSGEVPGARMEESEGLVLK